MPDHKHTEREKERERERNKQPRNDKIRAKMPD